MRIVIGGIFEPTAGIAHIGIENTGHGAQNFFNTPKAAAREERYFGFSGVIRCHLMVRGRSQYVHAVVFVHEKYVYEPARSSPIPIPQSLFPNLQLGFGRGELRATKIHHDK